MEAVDLEKGYWHLRVAPGHRQYLRFCLDGIVYEWRAAPFGIAPLPRDVTRLLRPVVQMWRLQFEIIVRQYIDDSGVLGKTYVEAAWSLHKVVSDLTI